MTFRRRLPWILVGVVFGMFLIFAAAMRRPKIGPPLADLKWLYQTNSGGTWVAVVSASNSGSGVIRFLPMVLIDAGVVKQIGSGSSDGSLVVAPGAKIELHIVLGPPPLNPGQRRFGMGFVPHDAHQRISDLAYRILPHLNDRFPRQIPMEYYHLEVPTLGATDLNGTSKPVKDLR